MICPSRSEFSARIVIAVDDLSRFLLVGELGLDGGVRPIPGMLPVAILAREKNILTFRPQPTPLKQPLSKV